MQPVIIDFGRRTILWFTVGLRIYGYGLMLVLGFLAGIYVARWRARRFGEDPEAVTTLGLLALVGGVAGARVAFVIERWGEQFAIAPDPLLAMLDITSGGLIYYGGVALATGMIVLYLAVRRLPVRRYLDIIAPSLMIGLAFGRMGCTLNGCCFGGPCREGFPLAMRFPYASPPLIRVDKDANIFGGTSVSPAFAHQVAVPAEQGGMDLDRLPKWLFERNEDDSLVLGSNGRPLLRQPAELSCAEAQQARHLHGMPLQPAQAYGVLNALLIASLLVAFSRLRRREGQVFLLMLILYPITRFVLEIIRSDNPHGLLKLEWTHNQWISIGAVALSLILWRCLRLLPASAGLAWRGRAAVTTQHPVNSRHRKGRP